ncbi:S-layer homology domain-containing protein [Bhargavaea ginsengi]|uniref:S-layer homology domain-containing protein n=1 Tax=Bhargavaea ginsengi TaxID=426757 RepID=UPI00203B59EA|nr:S-layer homology domain-containing protein [Bhargavaea ginsengi]MCM3089349.1 S-layer homology domain-containing protein [Bhargavaea ginsengi]
MVKPTNTKKKMLGMALTASLAAGTLFTAAPPAVTYAQDEEKIFPDLEQNQDYYSDVLNLAARGVVKGFPDGEYKPYREVTRAQAAKIIAGALELDTTNVKNPGFRDVSTSSEYYGYIAALAERGIIKGYQDSKGKYFDLTAPLTRSQMAKIIDLGYGLNNQAYTGKFSDVKKGEWMAEHVQALLDHNITKGTTATTFSPYVTVKRGQMASFIFRAEVDEEKRDAVKEARDQIFKEFEDSDVHDANGEVLVDTSFNREKGVFNITVSNFEEGIDAVKETGFFSDKMPELGVTHIKIGNNTAVSITEDFAAAKETLITQAFNEMELVDGAYRVSELPITLSIEKNGVEFEESFKTNVSSHSPAES